MAEDVKSGWPRVAVMGAGAVGCYFGGMLARAGAPVALIGRPAHVQAITRDGLYLDSIHLQETVRVSASTDAQAVREAALVLFCVKTLDTESAAQQIAPHLKTGAMVVSMQNGVENVERMRAAAGIEALSAVVYVAASMAGPGRVRHAGRGDLVIGHRSRRQDVAQVAQWFQRAGVPCRISENIEGDLWTKLIWNCAGNAPTALGGASYGQLAGHDLAWEMVTAIAREAIAVARAAGVQLPAVDLIAGARKLAAELGDATSSTAQDVQRGKRTEIDALNGVIVRRGKELGVPTPVNHTLFALMKLLEKKM